MTAWIAITYLQSIFSSTYCPSVQSNMNIKMIWGGGTQWNGSVFCRKSNTDFIANKSQLPMKLLPLQYVAWHVRWCHDQRWTFPLYFDFIDLFFLPWTPKHSLFPRGLKNAIVTGLTSTYLPLVLPSQAAPFVNQSISRALFLHSPNWTCTPFWIQLPRP